MLHGIGYEETVIGMLSVFDKTFFSKSHNRKYSKDIINILR